MGHGTDGWHLFQRLILGTHHPLSGFLGHSPFSLFLSGSCEERFDLDSSVIS